MEDNRFIKSIRLRNFLSYGPETEAFELQPLNVLIGPNASGKSNLVEAFSLLHSAPSDLASAVRAAGGVADLLWKGGRETPVAQIEVVVSNPHGSQPLRHRLEFTEVRQRLEVVDEAIENEAPYEGHSDVYFYYRYQRGQPVLNVRDAGEPTAQPVQRRLQREDVSPEGSVLRELREPRLYPELRYLAGEYDGIRVFGEWDMGRRAESRRPQPTDMPEDFLSESARNIALVLNDLQHRPDTRAVLVEQVRRLYPRTNDLTTRVHGGTVQLYLHERGLREPVPATRLSDGTLRYLCLLSVLCHPEPPPLVCIEEPELGLHPEAQLALADLLVEASTRTQLVVTTHSSQLIEALSHVPEAVVVCERDDGGTRLRRLDRGMLRGWLDEYGLADLWAMGEIGGNP